MIAVTNMEGQDREDVLRQLGTTIAVEMMMAAKEGRRLALAVQPRKDASISDLYILAASALHMPTIARVGLVPVSAVTAVEPDWSLPVPTWGRLRQPPK